jgi:hypothetical protein
MSAAGDCRVTGGCVFSFRQTKTRRRMTLMRFRVESRDVSNDAVARRLGIEPADFEAKLPNLLARGFPRSDPDTGNYDLVAIDRWMDSRNPHLFGIGAQIQARDASTVVKDRLAKLRASGASGG